MSGTGRVEADPAQIPEEGETEGHGRGSGSGHGHGEEGVGAELALVLGAVRLAENDVDESLVGGVLADQMLREHVVHVLHGLGHALPQVALGVSVPELHRFVLPGGSARGDGGVTHAPSRQLHFRLQGGGPRLSGSRACTTSIVVIAHLLPPGKLTLHPLCRPPGVIPPRARDCNLPLKTYPGSGLSKQKNAVQVI
jgi:hypothetical protein